MNKDLVTGHRNSDHESNTTENPSKRPSFTTNNDVINFQRLSKGAATAAAAATASSAPSSPNRTNEGNSKRLSINPFDEDGEDEIMVNDEITKAENLLVENDEGDKVIVETVDEVDSEKASIDGETCCSPMSAIDGEAGDLSRHQEVMPAVPVHRGAAD